jgi:hypothetical protein
MSKLEEGLSGLETGEAEEGGDAGRGCRGGGSEFPGFDPPRLSGSRLCVRRAPDGFVFLIMVQWIRNNGRRMMPLETETTSRRGFITVSSIGHINTLTSTLPGFFLWPREDASDAAKSLVSRRLVGRWSS